MQTNWWPAGAEFRRKIQLWQLIWCQQMVGSTQAASADQAGAMQVAPMAPLSRRAGLATLAVAGVELARLGFERNVVRLGELPALLVAGGVDWQPRKWRLAGLACRLAGKQGAGGSFN